MILSFHPCYVADENRLVAGKDPDGADRAALQRADAVILPQGCRQQLYEMAVAHCRHVFPNYDARFAYPGKTGQIRLFRMAGIPHPETDLYDHMTDYASAAHPDRNGPMDFPVVFKLNWGGEGQTVWQVDHEDALQRALAQAAEYEKSGMPGFLIQRFVPTGGLSLRVVVVGRKLIAYWRRAPTPSTMGGLHGGGEIMPSMYPERERQARSATRELCRQTGINLAGLDVVFDLKNNDAELYFLEINYFFGRRGLGGSDTYYRLLVDEINRWLADIGVM